MSNPDPLWYIPPRPDIPAEFVQAVSQFTPESSGQFAAQLLWQRDIRTIEQVVPFVNPDQYQPTSPAAFGDEMAWAIARLVSAYQSHETVAIWGDFDADGVTATSVLWDGLGEFFSQGDRLTYVIPNRLKESHGLSMHGLSTLADRGVTLIVTCDTGSTNLTELDYAQTLGMDVIITDHHTLPPQRPDVVAIINPRSLPEDHPLAHLSGVAVAYKLVEALHDALPEVPQKPLKHLLDLVAIGLIADLVNLTGDCRYLAQVGIQQLQTQVKVPTRPGIAALLNYCRRTGDRPTDISFGIGPRINAISRIHGDAHFCVDLLTSTDEKQCRKLAEDTELANLRRKALQQDVVKQVTLRLAEIDLSTTGVIVLADQWPVGVLGLVAGHIAQDYSRPVILLNRPDSASPLSGSGPLPIARGSARSINAIDLYDLVKSQSHLLRSFGGHPYAAGLSLLVDDVPLFADAINQEFRSRYGSAIAHRPILQADLTVRVADLGKSLFRELNLLEPYGMGNPTPRLLIQDCWFENIWNRKIQDLHNRKLNYIKTTFTLWDDSVQNGFPGTWWGHYKEDIPDGHCDVLVELDYNSSPTGKTSPHYEVRLVAVRPTQASSSPLDGTLQLGNLSPVPLLDWRTVESQSQPMPQLTPQTDEATLNQEDQSRSPIPVDDCPATWQAFYDHLVEAQAMNAPLAIAFPPPTDKTPVELWHQLVGIAKYLSRTQASISAEELQKILGIGGRSLQLGLTALHALGFQPSISTAQRLTLTVIPTSTTSLAPPPESTALPMIQTFIEAVGEEQFRQKFFHDVPASTLQQVADQFFKPSSA